MATAAKAKTKKKQKGNVMFQELDQVLDQIARDKNLSKDRLVEGIESAFLSAARKKWGHLGELEAHYDQEKGEIELFQFKTIAENVEDPNTQISVEEGKELDPDAVVGDSLGVKMDPSVFGRIAAQAAKQVIIQKVREAERDLIYNEYKDRVGEVIAGVIRRIERGEIIIDLGRAEACIPRSEQVRSESFKVGERIQAYFLEINPRAQGSLIILSRKNPQFVKKLFEVESPEVSDKTVEIRSVAREPGVRSKIAVTSKDQDVDPVGACVGVKGSRVQSVVQELRGEKIDIVSWDEDPARFICNAIAPAEVVKVIIKEAERSLEVIVPDDQLSLAIGRKGQNVRLAAHLTGWNVDVYSETKIEEFSNRCKKVLTQVLGFDESTATVFYVHGFRTFEDVAKVDWKTFAELPGVGAEKLKEIRAKAEKAVADGIKTETLTAVLAKEDEQRKAIEAAKKAEEEAALRQAQDDALSQSKDDAKKAEEEAKKAEEAGAEKPEEEKPAEEKIV